MINVFKLWDKGRHFFGDTSRKILRKKGGEPVGDVLSKCTICPVNNGTCTSYIVLQLYGFHPSKKGKVKKVWLCPSGHKNIDECDLSK
jgi:hypothetical protein